MASSLEAHVDSLKSRLETIPPEHTDRAAILDEIASAFQTRYEETGLTLFVNRSIEAKEEALQVTVESNNDYYKRFNSLRVALYTRYERIGKPEDLNRAISMAIKMVSTPGFVRVPALSDLGCYLASRYCLTGSTDDLNAAITAHENCIRFASKEPQVDQGRYLHNLGCSLATRYQRTRNLEDLSRAISVIDQAVLSAPVEYRDRIGRLSALANVLENRYKHIGARVDLERAIKCGEEVINLTVDDDSERPWYLANLGSYFLTLFDSSDCLVDLNKAISFMQLAVDSTPNDHPRRSAQLKTLACGLARRYLCTRALGDVRAATAAYEGAVYTFGGRPTDRVESGVLAAILLTSSTVPESEHDTPRASRLLCFVVRLLPSISPRTLLRRDQLYELSHFAGLATKATALCIQTGASAFEALELLEIGRGVTAGLLLDTRTDIADLEVAYPDLARQFNTLRDQLDSPIYCHNMSQFNNSNSPEGLYCSIWRHEAADLFHATMEQIRSLDQFDRFLLCPSQSELIDLASDGPIIVVNVAAERSDAILISESSIRRLGLSALCGIEVEERSKAFMKSLSRVRTTNYSRCNMELLDLLEWLWDVMVNGILEELGFTRIPKEGEAWPHVWWCVSGWLNTLPIHAAGYHGGHPSRNALNRVMSSYIPSLKSLVSARKRTTGSTLDAMQTLLVQMPVTPKSMNLPDVVKEVTCVAEALPPSFPRRTLDCPTKSEVLSELESCTVAHFACHGKYSPKDPSKSQLLLRNWEEDPLTVSDLVALKLKHGQLAYLSACNTASNEDETLLDENIHIAAACQLAGFPHVVGTLWKIQDSYSVEVARGVYQAMNVDGIGFDTNKASAGLHEAVRGLRNRKSNRLSSELWREPLVWAPYIHIGP